MTAAADYLPAADTAFVCPSCGKPMRVHTTRRPAAGVIHRYRGCSTCGVQSKTVVRVVRQGGEVVTRETIVPTRPRSAAPAVRGAT